MSNEIKNMIESIKPGSIDEDMTLTDLLEDLHNHYRVAERRASWDNIKGNDYVIEVYDLAGHKAVWIDDQYDAKLSVLDEDESKLDPEQIIRNIVDGWDHDDQSDIEWLHAWGYLDIDAVEVTADYDEPVNVLEIGCYGGYSPAKLVTDIDPYGDTKPSDILVEWDNAKAAQAWIDEMDSREIVLAHNEMGRASYYIVAVNK